MVLWITIVTAVTIGIIVSSFINTLITDTKWYRAYVSKMSKKYFDEMFKGES